MDFYCEDFKLRSLFLNTPQVLWTQLYVTAESETNVSKPNQNIAGCRRMFPVSQVEELCFCF